MGIQEFRDLGIEELDFISLSVPGQYGPGRLI